MSKNNCVFKFQILPCLSIEFIFNNVISKFQKKNSNPMGHFRDLLKNNLNCTMIVKKIKYSTKLFVVIFGAKNLCSRQFEVYDQFLMLKMIKSNQNN
ncbi:hypothetical protein BpHYR1_046338 [Brachionus plicatilis]|uniref:Uncharacterized protein n=1 Tax=Brachionus plicatilis TaxID=10195 RepID=A0A3M7PHM3_BRAPC|nr:hypothetical protein BpHYR1_046338 [Brachionus plicatilis]